MKDSQILKNKIADFSERIIYHKEIRKKSKKAIHLHKRIIKVLILISVIIFPFSMVIGIIPVFLIGYFRWRNKINQEQIQLSEVFEDLDMEVKKRAVEDLYGL